MKKTKIRVITMLFTMVLCISIFTVPAFASGGDDTEPPVTEVTPKPEEVPKPDPKSLTPEGNLTLVDDIETTDEIDKQFITAVSKNGNYFYLVIDRAGTSDNVYLLNMVDEADLMALMEGETTEPKKCNCTDKCEVGVVNGDCTICATNTSGCTGKLVEPTEPTEPESEESSAGILILLLVVGLGGGGAYYYFKILKNKPSAQGNPNVNEYDYDDDDEYDFENSEDSENADIQDEQANTDESEDDTK